MKNVLVLGSTNMDYTVYCPRFPLPGETLIGIERFVQPGGKGANQAAAIAKSHGPHCLFVGSRGDDDDGRTIESLLTSLGVECHFQITDAATGSATILISDSGENQIVIIPGANSFAREVEESLLQKADYVLFQNEIPLPTNEKFIRLAHKMGKKVVYNPAPACKIDESLFSFVDYLIVNETELAFYGGEGSLKADATALREKGVKNLIVTKGSRGSSFFSDGEEICIPATKANAVDTVSAGDTYVGYFVSGLCQEMNAVDAMKLASKASAITVSRKGSIISIPYGEEVK